MAYVTFFQSDHYYDRKNFSFIDIDLVLQEAFSCPNKKIFETSRRIFWKQITFQFEFRITLFWWKIKPSSKFETMKRGGYLDFSGAWVIVSRLKCTKFKS